MNCLRLYYKYSYTNRGEWDKIKIDYDKLKKLKNIIDEELCFYIEDNSGIFCNFSIKKESLKEFINDFKNFERKFLEIYNSYKNNNSRTTAILKYVTNYLSNINGTAKK